MRDEIHAEAPTLLPVPAGEEGAEQRPRARLVAPGRDDVPRSAAGLSTLTPAAEERPRLAHECRSRVFSCLVHSFLPEAVHPKPSSNKAQRLNCTSCHEGTGAELERRAVAAGVAIAELGFGFVPVHVQQALLHPVVEPGAAEDELAQPVDEGLALHERELLPVAHEVAPQRAARLFDPSVGCELDQVLGLVLVQVVALDQAELDGGRGHALLEVVCVEAEPVPEELDHVVLAGGVVRLDRHAARIVPRGSAVRPSPYRGRAMDQGTWTISPCPLGEAGALGERTRRQRNDRSRPRPARVRRRGGGESLPGRRAARPRPVPARRHGRRGRGDQSARSRAGSGSASTATTTRTESAPPRSPSSSCASSEPRSSGTCRAGSRRVTGWRARRWRGSPTRAAASF